MRATAIVAAAKERLARPITWGAIAVFGGILLGVRWGLASRPMQLHDLFSPFLWGFGFLVFVPVPWQWSGDRRAMASLWRGFCQAIPWNISWIFVLWLLIGFIPPRTAPFAGSGRVEAGEATVQAPASAAPSAQQRSTRRYYFLGGYFGFSMLLGWLLAEKEKAESEEVAAKEAANEARARALQSQMNPHVLFNAISGIAELVREDAVAAEDALVNLASLLRGILDHGSRMEAPLSAERALVEKYLGLEAIRLGRRLNVAWSWDRNADDLMMPPLLLQPLVENAIKHGIAPNRGGGELRIACRRLETHLELEVINSGRPLSGDPMEGVGIANLKSRLALLGCSDWDFAIWMEGGWTHARLSCGWRRKA